MSATKHKDIEKQYVKPGNPIAPSSQKYIDGLIANAKRRKGECQLDARVGDTVWCKFADTPKGVVNPGTIIRIEIDTSATVYTVLPDNSVDYKCFLGEDFGETIFTEDEVAT